MIELPRITRALRAHTLLEKPRHLKNYDDDDDFDLDTRITGRERYKSFSDICEYIKQNESNFEIVLGLLYKLKEACKALVLDQSDDMVEEITVIVLRMFLDHKVSIKDLSQLRQLFGDVSPSVANQISLIASQFSEEAYDETKEFIKDEIIQSDEEVDDLWGDNIELKYIPYKPEIKPLAPLVEKPITASSIVADFSMRYEPKKTEERPKSQYTKSWLEKKMVELYRDDSEERKFYLQAVLNFLHSKESNEEMQNEMIEVLGFDKLDFIQDLLVHRKEIVHSLLNQPPHPDTINETPRPLTQPPPGINPERYSHYICQVSVKTVEEKKQEKIARKEHKKARNVRKHLLTFEEEEEDMADQESLMKLKKSLEGLPRSKAERDSLPKMTMAVKVKYPHVYDALAEAKTRAFDYDFSVSLPLNAKTKRTKEYDEVIMPKTEDLPPEHVRNIRVPVAELDEIGQMAFENMTQLNLIQSIVYPTAYHTHENLLICAPTGAGKTNIALLTVVHQIKQHIENDIIMKNKFKIIYIAPMKALAAEMTASFSRRLQGLGIVVRELTGDMKLTKWEIQQTQMIVTTPEKWDIVTRKGASDTELSSIVKLLIIDEVHLLHGDRGPVIESIVARTLRQVESTQNMIRIVGLSATLPNYLDVAKFLRVNPQIGLFVFDQRFRPVPLEQQFIGVREIGSDQSAHFRQMDLMNQVCYEKTVEMVMQGHQVMVFVHARNATLQVAMILKELAQNKGQIKHFLPESSGGFLKAHKSLSSSRDHMLADLFSFGFSCHHAGMLRRDRDLIEKFFAEGYIKVLVCTSTLAWGVNLPAHAVIIRGTELYDEGKGQFVDLGILDVHQIFGRAGRPQFDTSGTAIIITAHKKLRRYITLMSNQIPIESNFPKFLADNLNAEIALGTVTNIEEAVEWLSYTFMYVRAHINPFEYGIKVADFGTKVTMEDKLRELIHSAALQLDKTRMIRYDERTEDLHPTDLGRSASHYYIACETMEIFTAAGRKAMTPLEVLRMIAKSSDFKQLKIRKDEDDELRRLMNQYCEWHLDSTARQYISGNEFKTFVLLQVHLARGRPQSSSLQSDLNYISQNAVRVARAFFEITLRDNNPYMAANYLRMAKMLELQLFDFNSDMRQFNCFSEDVLKYIEYPMLTADQIREMDVNELGAYVRNPAAAKVLHKCAEAFPLLDLEAKMVPITNTVLKIRLTITPNFKWSDKYHGKSPEAFWIWVEDHEYDAMYYHEYFLLTKKQVVNKEPQELVITIPVIELSSKYYIRTASERWLGAEDILALNLDSIILPDSCPPFTDLKDIHPVPVAALKNEAYESLYSFTHFNPMQSRIFYTLYHRDTNVLLGAPTSSGKTIVAEIAMFRAFNQNPNCKVVYIAPMKALVKERMKDWVNRFGDQLGMPVVELTGDVTPDVRAIRNSRVIVTTPEKWDGISRSWQTRAYVQDVALMIIDEVHLLGEDRGPVLEVIVSRANFIESHTSRKLRIVAMTTSMANAEDLGDWLKIHGVGLYNFRPYTRPVPLVIHVAGFPGRHYCPRMMTMNKPTFQAIRTHSPNQPSLVFVSSRRQTRLTALDLIAYLAAESNPKQWLHMEESQMEQILSGIRDSNLKLTLAFGIGLHHAGLHEKDRSTVEELFVNQKIQVLIATATLAWGVNLPAHLVVVKGTEYYDGKLKRYVDMPVTDVLQMIGRAGRPQFDNNGVAVVLIHDQKKEFYRKFFYDPLPVESSLLSVLPEHLNAEIVAGTVQTKQEILDYLTWTYFFRRLTKNPTYYELESVEPEHLISYLSNLVQTSLDVLIKAGCVEVEEDERTIHCTWMGRIASYYYLSYKTMAHFNESLQDNWDLEVLLQILSECEEYSTLPVRHNEDVINGELSELCRVQADPLRLDTSEVKTFLLLQAHLSRLPLPNSDYLTDTKSVLDQSIRIIQAMIDISAENGWLPLCLNSQMLMQCIVQARWHFDSPLTTLPYIEPEHLYLFTEMSKNSNLPCTTLNGLKLSTMKNYELLAKYLRREFDEGQIGNIHQIICNLPTIDVKLSIRGRWYDSDREQQKSVRQPCNRDAWLPVHADQEYILMIDMQRRGGSTNNIFCPRFPKVKNEGWFLTLGTVDNGELHALKRIQPKGCAQISFYPPSRPGRVIYTVYLLSDCYMGLDQQYDLQLEVVDPLPPEIVHESYESKEKIIIE